MVTLKNGDLAEIWTDPDFPSIKVLTMGGYSHSSVDVENPKNMSFLHSQKVVYKIEECFDGKSSLTALHLGGGGLSVPRYIEATRPTSNQVVVEIYEDLIEFVLKELPLPIDSRIEFIYGDAFDVVFSNNPKLSSNFDYIFVDAYLEPYTPEHLTTKTFYLKLYDRINSGGLLTVNAIDGPKFLSVAHHLQILSEIFKSPATADSCDPQGEDGLQNVILSIRKK